MKYTEVCGAKTKEEMLRCFDALLDVIVAEHGGTREDHRAVQLQNVGYFAGYYDQATFDRVIEWLGATHPFFGPHYPKNPQQAFEAGTVHAESANKEGA